MRGRYIFLTIFLWGAGALCAAEIDLTPVVSERIQDGVKFRQLQFAEGKKSIAYEPPPGWNYAAGGKHRITLKVPDKMQVEGSIEWLAQPLALDPAGIRQLESIAASSQARGSQEIKIAAETANPLRIDGHEVYEIVVDSAYYGARFESVLYFVNLGDSQLRFSFSCPKSDFKALHAQFEASLFGWQTL